MRIATTGTEPERQPAAYSREDKLRGLELAIGRDHGKHFGYAVARVGIRAAAEDIVQNAYLRAVEFIDNLRSPDEAPSWLWRIVHNCF